MAPNQIPNWDTEYFQETEDEKILRHATLKAITFAPENFSKLITELTDEEKRKIKELLEGVLLINNYDFYLANLHEEYFRHLKEELTPEEKSKSDLLARRIKEEGITIDLPLESLLFIFSNKSILKNCLIAKVEGQLIRFKEHTENTTVKERVLEIKACYNKWTLSMDDISEEHRQQLLIDQQEKITEIELEDQARGDKEFESELVTEITKIVGLFSPKLN